MCGSINYNVVSQSRPLRALLEAIKYFAGTQVRNMAAFGGNIATASPISDVNPILLALNCKINVASSTGTWFVLPIRLL